MSDTEGDYATEVRRYSNEELLSKERMKRRRKMGDVFGTGLTAVAAMRAPGLWAVAGSNIKSYLSNSSKHKIILQEIERRGLEPLKEEMSDTLLPILSSAGSMAVGRAIGGDAGQGVAKSAGDIMQSLGNRVFSSTPKEQKKDKKGKKVSFDFEVGSNRPQSRPEPAAQPVVLQTPASYHVPPNMAPPPTLVYHYVPPSAQYPRGYYAPAQIYSSTPVAQQGPVPVVQQPMMPQVSPPNQHAVPYQYAPPEPQMYGAYPQQNHGLQRSQTVYGAPPPYQQPQRAQTFHYT